MPRREPSPELVMSASAATTPLFYANSTQTLDVAHALRPREEETRDEHDEHAVDGEHHRRADVGRQVSAEETAERHAAAKRHEIDAHDAPAHLIGGDELH